MGHSLGRKHVDTDDLCAHRRRRLESHGRPWRHGPLLSRLRDLNLSGASDGRDCPLRQAGICHAAMRIRARRPRGYRRDTVQGRPGVARA